MNAIGHAVTLALCGLLLVAAWRDIAVRTIPDIISVLIAAGGIAQRAMVGPWPLVISLAAGGSLFLILALAHGRGMIGGADVKLIAAVSCGLSFSQTCQFIVITALAGGVLAVMHLILRRILKGLKPMAPPAPGTPLVYRAVIAERWRIARRGPLPYAVAIACGAISVLAPGGPG